MSDNDSKSEDEALWAWLTRDVTPLHKDKKIEQGKPPSPAIAAPEQPKQQKPQTPQTQSVATGTQLDKRTEERLRKGQIPIEARLDMHGMTQEEAYAALTHFVQNASTSGKRCLLIITGKGQKNRDPLAPHDGVLKSRLPEWLGQPPLKSIVLKTYPAQPKDGGGGAFYVYLRRKR